MIKRCPLCEHQAGLPSFPYFLSFRNYKANYISCASCGCVYLFPMPPVDLINSLYTFANYHAKVYSHAPMARYFQSVEYFLGLNIFVDKVLDFGCGLGNWLHAYKMIGKKQALGFEVSYEVATLAAQQANCHVVSRFDDLDSDFDLIHLGDVLEHVPYPREIFEHVLSRLRPGGYVFVEGPLESNPSLVYFAARFSGFLKNLLGRVSGEGMIPWHLWRSSECQQLRFFENVTFGLEVVSWEVYESGWPYIENGGVRGMIGHLAKLLSGFKVFNVTLGNRFRGVFRRTKLH